jgi:hypothetical protein
MAKNALHTLLPFLARRSRSNTACRMQTASRWTAAIAYSILALGIPIPIPAVKTSAGPFPCMNHRCGCQSAEECWRNCCCMTLEERLIWARENHVRPPDYALAEARAAGIQWAMNWPSGDNQQNSREIACAEPQQAHSTCQELPGKCHCCGPKVNACPCCACEHSTDQKLTCEERHSNSVILIEALKCHGVGENWQGLAISLPPPQAVQFNFVGGPVGSTNLTSPQFSSVSFPPDVPPPRFLVRG